MASYDKEPCPMRIVEDLGSAFTLGLVGGGIFQAIKGFRNGPTGLKRRFRSALQSVTTRAPGIGGQYAVWDGLYAAIECSLVGIRKKEDPWNSIISSVLAMFEAYGLYSDYRSAEKYRSQAYLRQTAYNGKCQQR